MDERKLQALADGVYRIKQINRGIQPPAINYPDNISEARRMTTLFLSEVTFKIAASGLFQSCQ